MARQSMKVQEDAISEDLLAGIPIVDKSTEATTFIIEPDGGASGSGNEETVQLPAGSSGSAAGEAIAQQLRYELGEALARELDRVTENVANAVRDLETRLGEAEAALIRANDEVERERSARELAEKRLAAFKELALK